MIDDNKVVPMPGVALQSKAGMTADETLLSCLGRYAEILIVGVLPDGSHEVNSYASHEHANWLLDRAKAIVMK
jgi:hypothetical protein